MDKVDEFTVNNVTNEFEPEPGAYGRTKAVHPNGQLNGHSKVYFNRNTTFSSYKRLFYTMGHELVHVSQVSALNGMLWKTYNDRAFISGLEFYACQYQGTYLGDTSLKGSQDISSFRNMYPKYDSMIQWTNFKWTYGANFKYPF